MDLTVTLIQASLSWHDPEANLEMFDRKIDTLAEATDLIVLPEMFTTGFSMKAERLAHDMNGREVAWLVRKAEKTGADIAGSMIIREQDRFYNRLIWAKPDGTLQWYDKKHLFRYVGEEKVYTPGSRRIQIVRNRWRISPFICYDLRFPLWGRNFGNVYDLAIFIANWPQQRAHHWNTLLRARAIENQCYVAGVNIVGKDGNKILYSGDSCLIDPMGNDLVAAHDQEGVFSVKLSRSILEEYRKSFPAWKDADSDIVSKDGC